MMNVYNITIRLQSLNSILSSYADGRLTVYS